MCPSSEHCYCQTVRVAEKDHVKCCNCGHQMIPRQKDASVSYAWGSTSRAEREKAQVDEIVQQMTKKKSPLVSATGVQVTSGDGLVRGKVEIEQ